LRTLKTRRQNAQPNGERERNAEAVFKADENRFHAYFAGLQLRFVDATGAWPCAEEDFVAQENIPRETARPHAV